MKKIGLVGGTGPESTLMYYKELNASKEEKKRLTEKNMELISAKVDVGFLSNFCS